MGVKEELELSELGTYQKVFPVLDVPVLGTDVDGYIKTLAEASIEQVKFLNAFAEIPLEVLYENIGQRHKASNFMALSVLRKGSQDDSTARGLDLIDIPGDSVSGEYSNAFLPVPVDKGHSSTVLYKGLLTLIGIAVDSFVGELALKKAVDLAMSLLDEDGFLREIALNLIDSLVDGVVDLVVAWITGKSSVSVSVKCDELLPTLEKLTQAFYCENEGTPDTRIACQLKKLTQAFYLIDPESTPSETGISKTVERMAKALYMTEPKTNPNDESEQAVETAIAQKVGRLTEAFYMIEPKKDPDDAYEEAVETAIAQKVGRLTEAFYMIEPKKDPDDAAEEAVETGIAVQTGKLARALYYISDKKNPDGTIEEDVETGLALQINEIYNALHKEILFVSTPDTEPDENGEYQKKAWTQALIDQLKEWSYQTESIELGGIRIALRANIIEH